ncbi:MAG: membrane protein insertase YidC [Alphaproteobacteria bacterium]|nr:membrane protein insertase YidC [Alphaproteobacteria bacterium]
MINDPDRAQREDTRNMILFVIASLVIWLIYDHLVLQPRMKAEETARKAAQEAAAQLTPAEAAALNPLPRDREAVLGDSPRLSLANTEIEGSIALTGGRVDDIRLRRYFQTLEKKNPVDLLSPAGSTYPRYAEFGWVSADESVKTPGKESRWAVAGNQADATLTQGGTVTLFWENGQGIRFERILTLDDHFLLTVTQRVVNRSGKDVTLHPYSLIAQQGLPAELFGRYIIHEGPIGYAGDKLTELTYKKIRKEPLTEIESPRGWIGLTEHYWFTGLIPQEGTNIKYRYIYTAPQMTGQKERFQTDMTGMAQKIATGGEAQVVTHLFVGPKKLKQIERYEKALNIPHFDLTLDFGMYYFLTKPFFYILEFFGRLTGNMGIALIILTVIVRIAVFPLANTSFKSFARLKKIAPEMQELRTKYGDDRQKLQEALVKLYEKEKVNPAAGCFPILVQIPIFFALYKVLQIAIEMRHEPFFGWIPDLSAADPTTIFNLFGLIPWTPPSFVPMIGAWPCMMLVFMLIQRQMNPPPQDKTQALMMNLMPFFMTFLLAGFASGLVIYWTFSNALSILQQYIIMTRMGVKVHFLRTKEEKEMEQQVAAGPAVHPKLEMIEDQVEDALFGKEDEKDAQDKPVSKPKPKPKKKKGPAKKP